MKICIVSSEVLPTPPTGFWGGTESVVADLTEALIQLGHDVTLVARPGSRSRARIVETFPDVPDKLGVNERHFNSYKGFVSKFHGVVHDHSNGKYARNIHAKVVNTMHWCQNPGAAGYRNITAISHAQAGWLKSFRRVRAVPVVHHGINPERFEYLEDKDDYYLFFSTLTRDKGAFEAFKIAKETGVKMVFAGKPGDASKLLKSCNLSNITYLGQVPNEKRAELYSKAKALVFPTGAFAGSGWLECFGLVQLEALASGTPVIASNNGACPEIIENGKTGFICKNYEEMKGIVKENRVEELSSKTCRAVAEGRFSAKRMATEYLMFYRKALAGAW